MRYKSWFKHIKREANGCVDKLREKSVGKGTSFLFQCFCWDMIRNTQLRVTYAPELCYLLLFGSYEDHFRFPWKRKKRVFVSKASPIFSWHLVGLSFSFCFPKASLHTLTSLETYLWDYLLVCVRWYLQLKIKGLKKSLLVAA